MRPRWRLGAAAAIALVVAGCGSSGESQPTRTAARAHLPSTAPYLEMTSPTSGILVWPSGSAWLLLSTRDGFAHVTNRTPEGVETDGGLIAAAAPGRTVVAVRAHQRLVRSPVLTTDHTWRWSADELPGAVADARAALSVTPATAVLTAGGGTLQRHGARGWTPVVAALSLGHHLKIDAMTWASAQIGWLTGSARRGAPTAYGTRDGGRTWTAVPQAAGAVTAALAPCGSGSSWLMPVVRSGASITVLRTTDDGARWTAGAPVPPSSAGPVMGCAGDTVWLDGRPNGRDRILSSSDGGGTWVDRGVAPDNLSDLTPTAGGAGFAASGGSDPQLWRVTREGAHFAEIALPGWTSSLGQHSPDMN